jgi:hypothetical protein
LLRVIVPGGFPGVPFHSMVTQYPSTLPLGAQPLAIVLGCSLLTLCALGLWARAREEGGLTAVYIAIYILGLSFWPSRSERFLWPILPPLLIFLPTGFGVLMLRLSRRAGQAARAAAHAALVVMALVIGWQLMVSLGIAATSPARHNSPDAACDSALPAYFADYEAAGRWLSVHSLPFERVLTARSSLFLSSGRFQQSTLLVRPSWPKRYGACRRAMS